MQKCKIKNRIDEKYSTNTPAPNDGLCALCFRRVPLSHGPSTMALSLSRSRSATMTTLYALLPPLHTSFLAVLTRDFDEKPSSPALAFPVLSPASHFLRPKCFYVERFCTLHYTGPTNAVIDGCCRSRCPAPRPLATFNDTTLASRGHFRPARAQPLIHNCAKRQNQSRGQRGAFTQRPGTHARTPSPKTETARNGLRTSSAATSENSPHGSGSRWDQHKFIERLRGLA